MPRWVYTWEAINPHADPIDSDVRWKVGIDQGLLNRVLKSEHETYLARLALMKNLLEESTELIYKGWMRPNTDGCFVYAGNPGVDYRKASIQTPPPKDQILLAFVLPDGTLDHWAWRKLDENGLPNGANGELLWS